MDWFQGKHHWAKLYRLIDRLPWWSQYKLAIADDDEIADLARSASSTPRTAAGPTLREWNPYREMIAEVRDATGRIEAAIANSARKKGTKAARPKPAARPLTAAQRAERRADYATHKSIVKAVLPRG